MDCIEKLAQHARDLAKPWAKQAANTVKCRGDRLSKILWKGRQWAVTTYGLEERAGQYHVQKSRLWKDEANYGWVQHMSEKPWCDLADFTEALRIARSVHAPQRPRETSNGTELRV
jgi:hypothetical protein